MPEIIIAPIISCTTIRIMPVIIDSTRLLIIKPGTVHRIIPDSRYEIVLLQKHLFNLMLAIVTIPFSRHAVP
jgi:hypothetical protein